MSEQNIYTGTNIEEIEMLQELILVSCIVQSMNAIVIALEKLCFEHIK